MFHDLKTAAEGLSPDWRQQFLTDLDTLTESMEVSTVFQMNEIIFFILCSYDPGSYTNAKD